MNICLSLRSFSDSAFCPRASASERSKLITDLALSILTLVSFAVVVGAMAAGGDTTLILLGILGLVLAPSMRVAMRLLEINQEEKVRIERQAPLATSRFSEYELRFKPLRQIGFFNVLPPVARFFDQNRNLIDALTISQRGEQEQFALQLTQECSMPLDAEWSLHFDRLLQGEVLGNSLADLRGMRLVGKSANSVRVTTIEVGCFNSKPVFMRIFFGGQLFGYLEFEANHSVFQS